MDLGCPWARLAQCASVPLYRGMDLDTAVGIGVVRGLERSQGEGAPSSRVSLARKRAGCMPARLRFRLPSREECEYDD